MGAKPWILKKLTYKLKKMNLLKKGFYILLLLLSITISCDDDDALTQIEGLDFVIANLNDDGSKVGVVPTIVSRGNVLYTVDFGSSADDDVFETSGPMVTYIYPKETSTYRITVTAFIDGVADVSITKEYTITIVVVPPTPSGGIVGTWKLAPEAGAIGVGPAQDDVSWWSSSSDDVTGRACLFDDKYVFNADGTFNNVLGDDTWVEAWQGNDPEGCATPVFPHDGTASATYTFNETAGTITIDGSGAFLGLAKVYNGGELTTPSEAQESLTYIAVISEDGNSMELDIEIADGGFWSFKLVKEGGSTPPPPAASIEGTWKLVPEAGAIGVGPAQDDVSWWSSSSDDVTGRACLFDDKYVFNADGTFNNVLGADTWVEAWQGNDPEGCAAPVFPHDGTASATYTYNATAGTITIDGSGAYLGLAKVYNGGELTTPSEAQESITYIATLSEDGNILELDIEIAGGGFWSFKLVRDVPPEGIQGSWKLAPEAGAIGVGPAKDDVSWWSNSSDDVTGRACLFDDEYVFSADGTFKNVLGDDTWVEVWQGNDPEGCAAPVFPHDGTASATYTYNESAGTITIEGSGAFLGLAKVYNGGELTTPSEAQESITYIAVQNGNTLELDIEIAGGGFWSFKLVRQ